VRPILEESGLVAGEDFALSFSPERIDPGNPDFRFENTPKVVGGLTEACRDRACDFYGGLVAEVVPVKGLKEAEMAKLLENTYRHVNIALVNELARISNAMGIDIWEVIRAAETKPYGFQAFRPGPGVGGHCIPIDPNYLSHRVRSELGRTFRFVELAQEINAGMAHYVVERVQELLNGDGIAVRGARIIVLGVSYKADIADVRESPAIPIVRELVRMGAVVAFHDPYVDSLVVDGGGIERLAILSDALAGSNCALLLQDHAAYLVEGALDAAPLVLDTRGRTAFTRL
jgi:nucleotide sugar dehydrogenase